MLTLCLRVKIIDMYVIVHTYTVLLNNTALWWLHRCTNYYSYYSLNTEILKYMELKFSYLTIDRSERDQTIKSESHYSTAYLR